VLINKYIGTIPVSGYPSRVAGHPSRQEARLEPGWPGTRHGIAAKLECVILIAHVVTAGKAAGDPVRLVNRMARGADVGVIQQIE
jgi:hypothetical protein